MSRTGGEGGVGCTATPCVCASWGVCLSCLQDEKCRFNPSTVGATDTGYVDIPSGDEDALTNAIATVGPISVAIDASHASFQVFVK